MEVQSKTDASESYFDALRHLEPNPITATVPVNADEEKALFLAGVRYIPEHTYPKLDIPDNQIHAIQQIADALLAEVHPKHLDSYRLFIDNYVEKARMIQAMHQVKTADSEHAQQKASREFMTLNMRLYGTPDKNTYISLLQQKIDEIEKKELSGRGSAIYDELRGMITHEAKHSHENVERFKPSEETIEWVQGIVESLYGPMLANVPEQESFTINELQVLFDTILRQEFGESADDWRVDIEPAVSINVKAAERRIVIPECRGRLSYDTVRTLIVHEIGVHVLRSIAGAQSHTEPLKVGLVNYYESEEGLGKVMEQALIGEYKEAGIDHYITAGAAYFDKKDFRENYEMKWRLSVLQDSRSGTDVTNDMIQKAKSSSYGGVMRIYRGTDSLPWFKDIAYYSGTAEIWKFLEEIRGDDFRFTLLMMGKINESQAHLSTILESHSK